MREATSRFPDYRVVDHRGTVPRGRDGPAIAWATAVEVQGPISGCTPEASPRPRAHNMAGYGCAYLNRMGTVTDRLPLPSVNSAWSPPFLSPTAAQ